MYLALACGDNAPAQSVSGTRLALRAYAYEDGTSQVDRHYYFDRLRGEPCSPQRWSDGTRYCTPDAVEAVYADHQCLTRVARVTPGSSVRYAFERDRHRRIARIYAFGDPYFSASQFTWQWRDGECSGPYMHEAPASYFQLADPVTRDRFVGLARTTSTIDSHLELVYDASDDGMRNAVAFHDVRLELDCDPRSNPNSASTECAPIARARAGYYADAGCTIAVAGTFSSETPAVVDLEHDGCTRTFGVAKEVACDPLWTAETCVASSGVDGERCFAAGRELELAQLARTIGTGLRIHPIAVGIGQRSIPDVWVHDAVLQSDCTPRLLGDQLRCVPAATAGAVVERFTDERCTNAVYVTYLRASDCAAPPSFAREPNGSLRKLAHPITGALFQRLGNNVCGSAPTPDGTAAYPVGHVVSDLMLASVQQVLLE